MKRRNQPPHSIPSLLGAALLVALAGCGGDDSTPDPTGADPDTSAGPGGPGTSAGSATASDPESTSAPPDPSTDGGDSTSDDTTSDTTGGPLVGTVLPSQCEPGATETLVETLQIPSDGTEITSMALAAGTIYRVEVVGTYIWGGCDSGSCPGGATCRYARFGDAEVQSDDCWQTAFHDQTWSYITLHVDGVDVDWRRYGTELHHYARVYDGNDSSLRFRINDCAGCYADNSGQLEVRISALSYDPRVWPNAMSCANSDEWLVNNHELVQTMRPRVLALNYDNEQTNATMAAKVNGAIAALADGSRYHGWDVGAMAQPALDYEMAHEVVDLRDDPPPPAGTLPPNGMAYPREDPIEGDMGLDYGLLFSESYAHHYGVLDPDDETRYLTLCEMVDRGMVHEVWFNAEPDGEPVGGREVVEIKPYYAEDRQRLPQPMGYCAGNGCMDAEDFADLPAECTRSLRIAFMDSDRGPGCLTHSLSHGIESFGRSDHVPYLQEYFPHFAGFDLDTEHGTTFDSWYGVCQSNQQPNCLGYPSQTAVDWTQAAYDDAAMTWSVVSTGSIADYDPVCGNMHFPPNATDHYDWDGPATVMTSCTSYRMGNAPDGSDLTVAYDDTVLTGLGYHDTYDNDCEGAWNVWWRQNFPGHQNAAWDAQGYPMLSWWPFLFY